MTFVTPIDTDTPRADTSSTKAWVEDIEERPPCLQRGFKLVYGVLYRLMKQTVAGYAIMIIGGILLYAAEATVEKDSACSARAEENLKRAAMRLLPLVDEICT